MPLLSIVIPVYNAANFIHNCLDSIWHQGIPDGDYEVICVDDCSKDDTCRILQSIQADHSNLRIEKNPQNLRAGGARNTGVRAARGEYVIFIDSDDYYHPGSLLKAFEYLKLNSDLDILTCNFARELPGKSSMRLVHKYYSSEKLSPAEYIEVNHFVPCSPWQWFFRRSLMTQYDIWFREHTIAEDVDWTHRLILNAKTIQYQPILLTHYVIDKNTQTALSYASHGNVYAYMQAGLFLYALAGEYKKIRQEQFLLRVAAEYIQQGLKYYVAMYDSLSRKIKNIKETIPVDLVLSKKFELCREHPVFYSCLSNIICPVVRFILKIKSRFIFRGIKLD